MKLLFLDIDGVLNSVEYGEAHGFGWQTSEDDNPIDTNAVERVNKITRAAGASIVISSAWRHLFPFADLCEILKGKGLEAEIIGKTPRVDGCGMERGHEIQAWLDKLDEKPTHFVILDDDRDMVHLDPFLVRTTWERGIQDKHVDKALEILEAA